MIITVTFKDDSSFSAEEAKKNNGVIFEQNADVTVSPDNDSPEAHIYFGIQNLISEEQIADYYENRDQYNMREAELVHKLQKTINRIIKKVLKDNLDKCR